MAATVKHFAGYGAPVAGREYNTVDMSEQQLRNDYLPPYKAAVDAGAATVMSAFNSLKVRTGRVSLATINNDVRHVLTLKYLAGMFDHPLTDPTRVQHEELTPAHLAAARTMAARSMVLLNNHGNALPLSSGVSSVAVVGRLPTTPPTSSGRTCRSVLDRRGQGGLGAG